MSILNRIYKAVEMTGGVTDAVIFTQSFKAFGEIIIDEKNGLNEFLNKN